MIARRPHATWGLRVLALGALTLSIISACGSDQQDSVGSGSEELSNDGSVDGNADAGCRHVSLVAIKSGGQQNWTASATLSPPMQFAIPATVLVMQNNAGFHSVNFDIKVSDGGIATCVYAGGGKAAQNAVDYPYSLSSCTNGLNAGTIVQSQLVTLTLMSGGLSQAKIDLDETGGCQHLDASVDATLDARSDAEAGPDVIDATLDGESGADAAPDADASNPDAADAADAADSATCDPSTCNDNNACNGAIRDGDRKRGQGRTPWEDGEYRAAGYGSKLVAV